MRRGTRYEMGDPWISGSEEGGGIMRRLLIDRDGGPVILDWLIAYAAGVFLLAVAGMLVRGLS